MSVRIRLKRAGSKKRPFYRVVVTDSRKARDSRSIEDLGYYNPLENPVVVNIDRERAAYWADRGALASETVEALLKTENSTHPVRRKTVTFVEPTPEPPKPKKKAGDKAEKAEKAPKAKAAKPAEAATAVEEAPAAEAPAAEAPAAEAPAAEAPAAEAPAAEAEAETPAKGDDAPAEKETGDTK